jgi:phage FluMu gp28-like protein
MLSAKRTQRTATSPGNRGGATPIRLLTPAAAGAVIGLRPYQEPLVERQGPGVVVLHWARQIGKSYTLAAWAVGRLINNPGRLVTVLSNSRDNGAEFVRKCAEMCRRTGHQPESEESTVKEPVASFRMEIRIKHKGQVGRIKVLAANPRTARGFSGDLILDEFAFHEDSAAIWEAAEPILASNPDFRCRIASTGNGKHNMFYRMANGVGPSDGTLFRNPNGFMVSRITRTSAWKQGVKIYDSKNQRKAVTPETARQEAMDKRAYDQNYECVFADENMTLLTYELIVAAQSNRVTIDSQEWGPDSLMRMLSAKGPLEVGNGIGRNRDLSMVTVIEREGQLRRVVAMLKMENTRLPDQQKQLAVVCRMPQFQAYCGDMTGLGLGLVEYLQEEFGRYRIRGVNFSATEPASDRIKLEGRKAETARVTEIMAVNLLTCFEERSIRDLPDDARLLDDLRKPEKITSPGGRVSIAATRDEAGHADGFWSLALAVRAGEKSGGPFAYEPVVRRSRLWGRGGELIG